MNDAEFKRIQATFPWTERVIPSGLGGVVQVIDRNGEEVPLFTMTAFLHFITKKLEPKEKPDAQRQTDNQPPAGTNN